ncbi:hypothetical protein N802_04905 [Knoellia sinensis KCTC 19936]|uniref:Uncharacterized protein n=1 Tax=Knoellia sinensis KCTC 19936 TaxID=1385520 RepID=A0A0A0J266_9MICO|nr:hypothetical protein [Knoellia sinensis]KGN31203.1 hypothetical protein N802_04905 [Knoellia sinensis KCTC 19936]
MEVAPMPTVGHPSGLSPQLPTIELTLPDGWSAGPGGDALFRATRGTGADLTPELTAYVHTSRETTTDELVAALVLEAREEEDGEADPTFEVVLEDRTWTGLNVSWVEVGEHAYVIHLITPVEAGEVTQFVHLSGHVTGADSEADYDEIQGILETVRVTPAAPASRTGEGG